MQQTKPGSYLNHKGFGPVGTSEIHFNNIKTWHTVTKHECNWLTVMWFLSEIDAGYFSPYHKKKSCL
jgi:hypothetical protein